VHDLVLALAQLPPDGWRLTIAGSLDMDPGYAGRVCRLIDRLGVGTHVEFLGSLPTPAVAECLSRAHVMAVPSRYEAFGIAYLEAMRFGVPVIATAAGGPREIVDDGREGFLVAPGDVGRLTRCLRALAEDRDLLVRMGRLARERADRHPSWAESGEIARELLCSVASAPQRQGTKS
jgi:glycosyltransferase involved in cell wall biosynthesis